DGSDGDGRTAARLFARKHLRPALAGVGGAILELGAGRGWTLRALAELGFADCRGVDVSPSQVALARAEGIAVEEGDARAAVSAARGVLWRGIEALLTVADAAESGRWRGVVYTRNLFVSARRPA